MSDWKGVMEMGVSKLLGCSDRVCRNLNSVKN